MAETYLFSLMAKQSMEEARQGNQETVELFDGVIQRDGLRDACSAGLDRIKLKLRANTCPLLRDKESPRHCGLKS